MSEPDHKLNLRNAILTLVAASAPESLLQAVVARLREGRSDGAADAAEELFRELQQVGSRIEALVWEASVAAFLAEMFGESSATPPVTLEAVVVHDASASPTEKSADVDPVPPGTSRYAPGDSAAFDSATDALLVRLLHDEPSPGCDCATCAAPVLQARPNGSVTPYADLSALRRYRIN